MILVIPLISHLLISLVVLSLPNLTRREILFGVVVPSGFRSSPDGRRAIRRYRSAVAIPILAGLIAITQRDAFSWVFVASLATIIAGSVAFVLLHRRVKAFAVQPPPIRVFELSIQAERLPWFIWLGLVPLLLLVAAALYLHANWNSIPIRFPVHWDINENPNRWTDRSFRGVYGSLLFGGELVIWLFGFALAMWYGSRQSEPLRKPMVGFVLAVEWTLALTMAGVALGPLLRLPVAVIAFGGMAIILLGLVYLVKRTNDPRAPVDPTPNECWKGGMIYYNPNDAALFVARRDGIGFTSNMGNPWSWVMLGSVPVLIAIGILVLR